MAGCLQPDGLPAAGGAYALLIRLDRPLVLDIGAFAGAVLRRGLYAYCGSAYGPGGLRARVARHMRPGKTPHWHVDCLTAAGMVEDCAIRVGGRECDLVDDLAASGGRIVLPGFGSSDCRRCAAHLLAVTDGEALAVLGR